MSTGARFLLCCAVLFMFPSLAASQPVPLAVQRVWTKDAGGGEKTTFVPGETIQLTAQLNNSYGGYLLAANGTQLTVTTSPSFYNDAKPVDIPPGVSTWTWSTTAPSTEASYTVRVLAYDHFYGGWAEGSAGFTVGQESKISSKAGWQQTNISLQPGDTFKIGYSYGAWTVDYRYFKYVGPVGYPSDIDQQIYQGCKTVPSLPYGTLLGKIGDGPIFFAGKAGTDAGWFKATATGPLYLRINDNEACHSDNDGEIAVTVAKEQVNLADTIKPGGTWIEPADNSFVTEPRLKLSARVSDNAGGSGIARVHFTTWWPGEDDKVWHVICAAITPKPGTSDVYECEWDLSSVPNGEVRVSFDVYDKAGNSKLAPNGVHNGTFQKATPPLAEGFKCDWLLGCTFRINHDNTQKIIKILDAVGAPGVDEQLIYACGSILLATGGSPPGWGCALFAAGLQIGLPLTQFMLTNFDTGQGVVLYFFYGSAAVILPPALSPIK